MKFGTFCSGIGAPECAWVPLGFQPQFVSEIEPFPCAVLAHHHPDVPNLGDMTKITDEQISRFNVDVVCAGTPCQSFSVAGLRKGMADPRGNLALVFLRLVDRLRPRWLVWENVPGVLSSSGGRDFGTFLGGLAELGYGWAYRTLDAQYAGVPQRRRRVFVVGYLGDWRRAAAVLFERHGLSGNPPPSRKARSRVAATITRGTDSSGKDYETETLIPVTGGFFSSEVAHSLRADGFDASEDGTGRGTPLVPIAFDTTQVTSKENRSNPKAGDPCRTLSQQSHPPSIATPSAVRRLTPLECERLQGFPEGHTAIQFRGKPAADSPRYRAIGNSMAVPVMAWIGKRILEVEAIK